MKSGSKTHKSYLGDLQSQVAVYKYLIPYGHLISSASDGADHAADFDILFRGVTRIHIDEVGYNSVLCFLVNA